jgi:glucose/arabinose dehydrogenase
MARMSKISQVLLLLAVAACSAGCADDDEDLPRADGAVTLDAAEPVDGDVADAAGDADAGADAAGDPADAATAVDASIAVDAAIDARPPTPDAAPRACTPAELELDRDEIGRGFGRMTSIKSPPGDPRIFVSEKEGVVSIVDGDDNVLEEYFLDLGEDIDSSAERGLLGIAFHPGYAQNRRFFVFYTAIGGAITIAEGRARAGDPDRAEAGLVTLFSAPHSTGSHNGGWLDFGPDGYLYATIGDNLQGAATAQDPHSVLGKVIRLDVSTPGSCEAPGDNPFAGGGGRPEVWAYGLRNPWRASFDPQTGDLYIADVGFSAYEEVNVQPASSPGGENYGWNIMEGAHCFNPGCDSTGLTQPVFDYDHEGGEAAIIGGHVYRGDALPECAGTYFFADYVTGDVQSFRYAGGGGVVELVRLWDALSEPGASISTFGVDRHGELLIGDDGVLFRLIRG